MALTNTYLQIAATNMDRPGKKVKGFSQGSDPPVVRRKSLNIKSVNQSNPVAGARNRIQVKVESSSDVSEMDITVWPLTGATFLEGSDTSVCTGGIEWDGTNLNGPTIKFKSCVLLATKPIFITFYVTNPTTLQNSPDMFIKPSDPIFGGVLDLVKGNPGTFFGIAGFYQPMKVVRFELTNKRIAQSTPVASRVNTLTVTLESTLALTAADSSVITISNLMGAVVASQSMALSGDAKAKFCAPGGAAGTAAW
eukprot:CAMPEP_0180267574 /NCGR_PEP_ID=MMETSP0988-20121125/1636_1 /TAXON_ID=697907 /ORGANISM="non described non described, Strain CCMP2293" /LENGTH=251 /DNA_ID=CAMNT_0022238291 /DNA_START=10 /DNA_END=762 /DNA_ORIENTATION=-